MELFYFLKPANFWNGIEKTSPNLTLFDSRLMETKFYLFRVIKI